MNVLPREVSRTGKTEQALISAIVNLVEKGLSREVSRGHSSDEGLVMRLERRN